MLEWKKSSIPGLGNMCVEQQHFHLLNTDIVFISFSQLQFHLYTLPSTCSVHISRFSRLELGLTGQAYRQLSGLCTERKHASRETPNGARL